MIRERINRVICILILTVILFTFIVSNFTTILYASTPTANSMGSNMISFFQTANEEIDIQNISTSELQVYGVFLSNFFTPGQTQLKDLSIDSSDSIISNKISEVFFNSSSTGGSKVKELNNIVYSGIFQGLENNKLTDKSGKAITGQDFIASTIGKNGDTKIYRNGGQVEVLDFSYDSFRGAMKILGAQSAGFIVDREYGIPAMTEMYIDPFGNIWGAFDIERQSGDATDVVKTPKTDVHLVLPAALNPAAFTNTGKTPNLSNSKLPLNNAFAMGSLVPEGGVTQGLSNKLTGYYNIPSFFTDKSNALYIYAVNSPMSYMGKTESLIKESNITDTTVKSGIKKFIGDKRLDYTENFNIVLGNRLDVMSKTLQNSANTVTGTDYLSNNELYKVYEYFYGNYITSIDKTISDIFYFGEGGNETWANTTFNKLGLVGINMFSKEELNPEGRGTGNWHIHSSDSQVLSKVAQMYVDGDITTDTIEYTDINKILDETRLTTFTEPGVREKLDAFKNTFLAAFGGKYYIHGVNEESDNWLYKELNGENLGVIGAPGDAYIEKYNALYHTLNTYSVLSAKTGVINRGRDNITITKSSNDSKQLTVMNDKATAANWPGIFWGYMVEMLSMADYITYDSENNVVSYGSSNFYSTYLPRLPDGLVTKSGGINLSNIGSTSGVASNENKNEEDMKKDLLKRLYSITTNGPDLFRDSWLKSSVDGFVLSTHRAITGSWLADVATVSSGAGSTYSSIVGYVHTPSLYELPFTSWIMTNYMQIYILAMLFIIVVLIFMVIMGIRTWQQGLLILFAMFFILLAPNILVENTINIGNKVTDGIYSDRFDFWALTQHQQSENRIKGAEVSSSEMDMIITNTGEKVQNIYSQDAGVRVKWMAPKKDGTFDQLFNSKYLGDSLATNLTIFRWLFSSFIYEQEFVSNDPLATYMYRPYNSIAKDARDYYDYAKTSLKVQASSSSESSLVGVGFNDTGGVLVPDIIQELVLKTQNSTNEKKYSDMFVGSAYWFDKSGFTKTNELDIYWSEEQKIDITEKGSQYPNYKNNPENRTVSLWGLGSEVVTDTILEGGSFSSVEKSAGIPSTLSSRLEDNTDPHLVAFYKNTESPFYYFYNTLRARYGDGISFKSALLETNIYETRDIGVFTTSKNTNRMVRDFLDMEGLFTNIVPYMTIANNYVYEWTKINGTDVPDFNFNADSIDAESLGVTEENSDLYQSVSNQYRTSKKQRDDLEKVWMMYTPWVDQINSLNTVTETITVGNKRTRLVNSLNPSYYLDAGRPMIFSEIDMTLKGYTIKDLTDTEQRIQRVLDTTYRDMMYLVNYYDLDDEVLINAAAMYATFNFNREFSQTNLIGESVMLYPQSFEMKNFNYDAFMRMIMLNATGEAVFGTQDLYVRILEKTSFFTGVMLLLVDVLAVIGIPTMKIIILLMLLFLSILLCITGSISPPEKLLKVISKSLILPTLIFLGVNILFAYLVSLLVGEGLTSYVGSRTVSIVTNDPSVTLAILIIMSIVYIVAMFKIMKMLFESIRSYGMAGIIAGAGIVVGGVTATALKATRKATGVLEATGGAITGGVTGAVMSEKGSRISGGVSGAKTGARGHSVYTERASERRMAQARNNPKSKVIKEKIEEKSSTQNNTPNTPNKPNNNDSNRVTIEKQETSNTSRPGDNARPRVRRALSGSNVKPRNYTVRVDREKREDLKQSKANTNSKPMNRRRVNSSRGKINRMKRS